MTTQPNGNAKDNDTEKLRINRAFQLAVIGLFLAAVLVFGLLLFGWKEASDITSVVGLFTSVLGTLVGAFFGLQIGASGKEAAEERADMEAQKADALGQAADPATIERAKELYPKLFG